jgi:hypothetical protein
MPSLKLLSNTFSLDLTSTATAAGLQLIPNTPTRAYIVAVVNTGTDTAAVSFGTTASNMPVPVVPASGTSASFVLPPEMRMPILITVGSPDIFVKGISTGTNTVYFTLVGE